MCYILHIYFQKNSYINKSENGIDVNNVSIYLSVLQTDQLHPVGLISEFLWPAASWGSYSAVRRWLWPSSSSSLKRPTAASVNWESWEWCSSEMWVDAACFLSLSLLSPLSYADNEFKPLSLSSTLMWTCSRGSLWMKWDVVRRWTGSSVSGSIHAQTYIKTSDSRDSSEWLSAAASSMIG